jgi:conjugal transfer pilus assembly protein TraD
VEELLMPTRYLGPLSVLNGWSQEQWVLATALSGMLGMIGLVKAAPLVRWPRFGAFRGMGGRRGIGIGSEWIPDEARLRHTHIVGATGSGKTVLLEQMIYRDLERGHGALIIDPKGDRELYERVRGFCRRIGRGGDLHLLSATYQDESIAWNPCRVGSASELQSKFYNSAIYSEPHYAKACELALLKAFNQLTLDGEKAFSLTELVEVLDELSRNGKDETVAGLYLDLNNLVQGDWGTLLGCQGHGDRREVTLYDVTRKNEILFVDLPTEAQAVQSARIGRLLLQEVILISGLRKLYPHLRTHAPFSVFVDEFDAFAFPAFATFLNKGRSSGFMIHLAHQTLSDLDRVGPAFRGQIMGNMNVRFIFRQDEPDDAEAWSRFFGTRTVVKRTYQTQDGQATGASSNRAVQEFRISPDSIKELKTGECIFSMKTFGAPRCVRVPFSNKEATSKFKFPQVRAPSDVGGDVRPKTKFDRKTDRLQRLISTAKETTQ